jgi:hypothetical protein
MKELLLQQTIGEMLGLLDANKDWRMYHKKKHFGQQLMIGFLNIDDWA